MYPQRNGRITGGEISKTPIPYQLSLFSVEFNEDHYCGGVIIAPKYGLSAFHCFYIDFRPDYRVTIQLAEIIVRAGMINENDDNFEVNISIICLLALENAQKKNF